MKHIRFVCALVVGFSLSVARAKERPAPPSFFFGTPPIPMAVYTGTSSGTHRDPARVDQHRFFATLPVYAHEGGVWLASVVGSSVSFFERPFLARSATRLDSDWERYEGALAYARSREGRHLGGVWPWAPPVMCHFFR